MNLSPETQIILSWMIGGAFWDQIKIASSSAYHLAKETLANNLPLNQDELDLIEAEIVSCDEASFESFETLQNYITDNNTIQEVLVGMEQREPAKLKEIVNSFKNNKNTKMDLELGDSLKVQSAFNNNSDSEINIK